MKTPSSSQRGVSMIEALVAMLVLALGVMGLAGIQTRTLVEGRTSNSRTVAVQMADDLLDRIQSNSDLRNDVVPAVNPYTVVWGAPAAAGTNCETGGCNANQLAAYDLRQWKTTIATLLPAGDARVFQSPTDPKQLGVLIGWARTQAKNELDPANTAAQTALYDNAADVRDATGAVGTGSAAITCPAALLCHLVYIRP
jgi:type IV pilus assembly protein PilV